MLRKTSKVVYEDGNSFTDWEKESFYISARTNGLIIIINNRSQIQQGFQDPIGPTFRPIS